jgi:channel protein (hemolysin III family)
VHGVRSPKAKQRLRVVDHSAIYLLIAGTYTPFLVGPLRGAWGWSLLAVIWSLALTGVLYKAVFGIRMPHLSTALYLAMGWLIIVAIVPLVRHVPGAGLAWLLAGEMAVAYFQFHHPQAFFPTTNNGVPAVMYSFFFLYLVFAGPGVWSIDALIGRRRSPGFSR